MSLPVVIAYALLAGIGVLLSFTEPFTGIGVLRAAPTAMLALAALPRTRARFGYAILMAVALGSAGDFFLAGQSRAGFIPGLVSFLIGHLVYLWAFTRDLGLTRGRGIVLVFALFALAALSATTAYSIIQDGETAMLAPILIYILVLALTMVVCLTHRSPTPFIAAGAVLFVYSDAHIAVNHMVLETPLLPITLSGYTTYYLAQFLLVHGAARETAAGQKRSAPSPREDGAR